VADVKCLADASQSYALYLPSTYSPDKAWPLLMGFHPGARGIAIVEKYRAAAEKYGYIVAASNNSRNGPWAVSERAVVAMTRDLAARFSTDEKRLYATGHSGGARVAMQIALTNPLAGVIASSAGYPDSVPRSKLKFVVFGTAGDTDFNYIELKLLDNALKTPHRVAIFDGGHTLPPDDLAMEAIEWLELQAIRSGIRPLDDRFLQTLWDNRLAAATAPGVDPVASVERLRALVEGLQGTAGRQGRGRHDLEAAQEPETKHALDRKAQRGPRRRFRRSTMCACPKRDSATLQPGRRASSVFSNCCKTCRRRPARRSDSPERDSARRLLRILSMNAAERTTDKDYLALLEKYKPAR
jgi:dienelactone hydrolase